jgi:putative copper export protein
MQEGVIAAAGGAEAVALRFLTLAAIVGLLGAAAFRLIVWPRAGRDAHAGRIAARLGVLAGCVAAVCVPLRVWVQARALADPADPMMPMFWSVLRTAWGHALEVQAAAALVAAVACAHLLRARPERERMATSIAVVAAVLISGTPAWSGHAAASASYVALAVAADVAHVVAAGCWIGALVVLAWLAQSPGDGHAGTAVPTTIRAFHPLALGSAAVVVASGIVTACVRMDHVRDLTGTTYGRELLVKLSLVMAVLAFGWRHSRTSAHAAVHGNRRALAWSLLAEAAVALALIGVTAVLSGTSPGE